MGLVADKPYLLGTGIQAAVEVMGDQRIPTAIEIEAKRIRAAVGVEDLISSWGRGCY